MMVGRMLSQKDFKFATKLGYIARPCIMKKKKKRRGVEYLKKHYLRSDCAKMMREGQQRKQDINGGSSQFCWIYIAFEF